MGEVVAFYDVDFRVDDDFWGRLLKMLAAMRFTNFKKSILSVPAFFLSVLSSKKFADADIQTRFFELYLSWLQSGDEYRGKFMAFSSIAICNRRQYLAVGGQHLGFEGWGGEDFEFLYRMMKEEGAIPPPLALPFPVLDLFQCAQCPHISRFSRLCLHGRPTGRVDEDFWGRLLMECGLFTVHLGHRQNARFYKAGETLQRQSSYATNLCAKLATQFDRTLEHPPPIVGADVKGRMLFVGNEKINPESCLRDILPLLGKVTKGGEPSREQMAKLIEKHRINLVLFYEAEKYKELVSWCRKNRVKTLFAGRGIMPDSWFFSPYSSAPQAFTAYCKKPPGKSISPTAKKQTAQYLREHRTIADKAAKLMEGAKNRESLYRFVYFLRNEFYSFAKVRPPGAKSPLSAPMPPLDFYEIRLAGKPHCVFEGLSRPPIPMNAPLFERFRINTMSLRDRIELKLRIALDILPLPRTPKNSFVALMSAIKTKLTDRKHLGVASEKTKIVERIYPTGQ